MTNSSGRKEIGQIVSGSLSRGLQMKLNSDESVEDVRAGKFVVVEGDKNHFFSMITDVILDTSAKGLLQNPPERSDLLMRQVLSGTSTFGTIELKPMLMLPISDESDPQSELRPVKTIPGHFSAVYTATAEDVNRIFGDEESSDKFFHIGSPLDMEDIPVCLNLERLVERSNGIFGKSGTGKTFLTRIVLCGIIKNRVAVNLIFDMHSEYGWKGTFEGESRKEVRGLKQYFGDRVSVFSLDPDSSRRRKAPIDVEVKIPYSQVTIDDIMLLQQELNLTQTAVETGYALVNRFKENRWLTELLKMDADAIKDFCENNNVNQASLSALQRKLRVLAESCKSFLVDDSERQVDDAVRQILSYLEGGRNVVLEFGQHTQPLRYMLVANILTRRIHERWAKIKEESMGGGGAEPTPLMITIEEAHKFLSPSLADQTIFGTIAREMRKYNVTLLVVDQRPSGIDSEILSQVGTKITCLLNDDKDIDAVLTGVSNASGLRGVLASLDTKQQALILGHAVPMPVVVQTRLYDDEKFRGSMGLTPPKTDEEMKHSIEQDF